MADRLAGDLGTVDVGADSNIGGVGQTEGGGGNSMGISSIGVGTIGIGVGSKEVGGIGLSVTLADGMDSGAGDGDIGSVHTGSRLAEGIVVGIGVASIAIGAIEESWVSLSIGSSNQSRCKDKELHDETALI